MMHVNLYSVLDRVAKMYGPVFQAVNDDVARRNVVHMLEKVPAYDREAFVLQRLGTFDDELGHIDTAGVYEVSIKFPDIDKSNVREFSFERDGE